MKKIFAMFAMLMLLIAVAPMALADDNETFDTNTTINMTDDVNDEDVEVTEEDEEEIEVMTTPYGAEVRLEQLKLSIERNIERGTAVIEENNFTEETSILLTGILDDLSSLIEDIDSLDLEQEPSILAQEYVAVKKQAISLSNDFKKEVHKELSAEKIEQVKARVQERAEKRVEELKQRLHEKKVMYEHRKATEAAKRLGIEVDDGATVEEIVDEIKSSVKEMTPEQRENAARAYREFKAKERVMIQATKEKARENAKQVYLEKEDEIQRRIQQRIDDSNLSPAEKEIMQKRMEEVRENTRERVLNNIQGQLVDDVEDEGEVNEE